MAWAVARAPAAVLSLLKGSGPGCSTEVGAGSSDPRVSWWRPRWGRSGRRERASRPQSGLLAPLCSSLTVLPARLGSGQASGSVPFPSLSCLLKSSNLYPGYKTQGTGFVRVVGKGFNSNERLCHLHKLTLLHIKMSQFPDLPLFCQLSWCFYSFNMLHLSHF